MGWKARVREGVYGGVRGTGSRGCRGTLQGGGGAGGLVAALVIIWRSFFFWCCMGWAVTAPPSPYDVCRIAAKKVARHRLAAHYVVGGGEGGESCGVGVVSAVRS